MVSLCYARQTARCYYHVTIGYLTSITGNKCKVVSDVSCDMEKGIDILYTRVYNIINKRERQSNGSGAHKDPINNPADAGKEETNKLNWIMGS